MLKILLLPLLFTNFLFAQDTLEFKPMTWENLLEFQKDSLLPIKSLKLSTSCPKTIKEFTELKNHFIFHHTKIEKILGTYFRWTEFYTHDREICVIKHTVAPNTNRNKTPIYPKTDIILSVYEARILMSAEAEYGFKLKNITNELFQNELFKLREEENLLTKRKLKPYGGIATVETFIKTHKSNTKNVLFDYEFIKSNKESSKNQVYPPSGSSLLLNYFEKNYSKAQKQVLIDETLIKNKKKLARILSYSKSNLELLDNSWRLVSIKDTNSSRKNILEKSNYMVKFDKETMKFSGSGSCNTRSGRFILNEDSLYLIFEFSHQLACSYFKESAFASKISDEHPKEKSYRQQTKSIKNIINLVIGYEINDSELILFTRDSRKLFFKKVST